MLRFVTDELQDAEDKGQRVWILGHVLPGAYLFLFFFRRILPALRHLPHSFLQFY